MSVANPKPPKTKRSPAKTGATYHGVQLAKINVPTRFTDDQIKQAVEAAIAKNPDVFVRKS